MTLLARFCHFFHLLKPSQLLFQLSSRFNLMSKMHLHRQIIIINMIIVLSIIFIIIKILASLSLSSMMIHHKHNYRPFRNFHHYSNPWIFVIIIVTLLIMCRTGMFSSKDLYLCDITEKKLYLYLCDITDKIFLFHRRFGENAESKGSVIED